MCGTNLSGTEVIGNSILQLSMRYNITFKYNGSINHIYVNGINNCSKNMRGVLSLNISNINIGKCYNGGIHFNGYLDNIYIYSHALSEVEIKAI